MQKRIAVIYGTSEGQTRKISDFLASRLRSRGCDVAVMHVDELPLDYVLDNSDAIILGASIHVGHFQKAVVSYVREHVGRLSQMPGAFFAVSLSAATGEQEQAEGYVKDLREETGWEPDLTVSFGGALRYTQYNFLVRPMMRSIAEKAGADTDTSQDWEYTDWDAVESFADDVFRLALGEI